MGRLRASTPPGTGAVVMGTGIVSISLGLDGRETLSRVVLVIAAAIWVVLVLALALRVAGDRAAVRADIRTPAALTAPIATCVLGVRLTTLGWTWAGVAALILALALWAFLIEPVLMCFSSPTVGGSLLVAVAPEALAMVAVAVAVAENARWLLIAALAPFTLGLGFYVWVISRFDLKQLRVAAGDHWITGGALGICALVAARIMSAADTLGTLHGATQALQDLAVLLWIATMLWLVVLLIVEARWPRPGYDLRRWSTIFPLGMYAACSFAVGAAAHAPAIRDFARVWVWVAAVAWAIVFLAMARRVLRRFRATRPAVNPEPMAR